MSRGGAAKLVHTWRITVEKERQRQENEEGEEERENDVMVKIDVKNAFNCASRHATVAALRSEDSLQHLAWAAAVQLAPQFALESGGECWGVGAEGATQGDPAAILWFGVSWHSFVRYLNATLKAAGGFARFGADTAGFGRILLGTTFSSVTSLGRILATYPGALPLCAGAVQV